MNRIRRTVFVVVAALSFATVPAFSQSTLTQSWVASWTVVPFDYYGTFAAQGWEYFSFTRFDPAFGDLVAVRLHESVFGSRESATDPFWINMVFFASQGWPGAYGFQFGPGGNDLAGTHDDLVTDPASLLLWTSSPPDPGTGFYIGSYTQQAGHTITAEMDLTYVYTAATPEPATLLLLGTGLVGMLAAAGALKRSAV